MNLSKQEKKYLWIIGGIIAGLFYMEYSRPTPINWTPTFSKADKVPYGGELLYKVLPHLFEAQALTPNRVTFYERHRDGTLDDFSALIMINNELSFTEDEGEVLADWVKAGGTLFVASTAINNFGDSLFAAPKKSSLTPWAPRVTTGLDSSDRHQFANPILQKEGGFIFRNGSNEHYFSNLLKEKHTVLAYDSDKLANFIKIEMGQGAIYWHANPLLFTNYNLMLHDNYEYLARAFSYIDKDEIVLWDEYYKVGRVGADTKLRVILTRPSLAWAWFIALGSMFTFIIFNMKRKQRALPIIAPPENTTVEFAETIGRLYLQHKDHQGIVQKMQRHFKDHVKRNLYVSLDNMDSKEEIQRLADKSGLDYDWIFSLFKEFNTAADTANPSDQMLKRLYLKTEQFYKTTRIEKIG